MINIKELCMAAKNASYELSAMTANQKNDILTAIADAIIKEKDFILAQNKLDIETLKGKDSAFLDRLTLNEKRIQAMSEGIKQIVLLPDPVGEVTEKWTA